RYQIQSESHELLDMPLLIKEPHVQCVNLSDIKCLVNVQHDCVASKKCGITYASVEVQEGMRTCRSLGRITHHNDGQFILNVQALHNAQHIRAALPGLFGGRRSYTEDPAAIYHAAAEKLTSAAERKARARKAARDTLHAAESDTDLSDSRSSPEPPRKTRHKRRRKVSVSSDSDSQV
ncbi:hypothetical protein FRC09_005822, partial [Ceratobasidium sp. 395]